MNTPFLLLISRILILIFLSNFFFLLSVICRNVLIIYILFVFEKYNNRNKTKIKNITLGVTYIDSHQPRMMAAQKLRINFIRTCRFYPSVDCPIRQFVRSIYELNSICTCKTYGYNDPLVNYLIRPFARSTYEISY